MSARPMICCPRCHGARRVPLPDGHWDTLLRLRALGTAIPTQLISRGETLSLINNRLTDLRAWGFVDRKDKRRNAYVYYEIPACRSCGGAVDSDGHCERCAEAEVRRNPPPRIEIVRADAEPCHLDVSGSDTAIPLCRKAAEQDRFSKHINETTCQRCRKLMFASVAAGVRRPTL